MMAITLIFGLPLLLAGAMLSRTDVRLAGLVSCVLLAFVALPFIAWRSFLIGAVFPPPGESRSGSLVRFWVGASLLVVAVMFFIGAVLDYPPAGIA